jgi:hypothetical protein
MKTIGQVMLWVLCFFLPGTAFAIMPPPEIAKLNLEAELILVGEVTETGSILLADSTADRYPKKGLFVVKVLHVVKGYDRTSPGDQIRVIFRPTEEQSADGTVTRINQGILPVKVADGNLVVVYLNPAKHQGFYQPVAGGASVAVIAASR